MSGETIASRAAATRNAAAIAAVVAPKSSSLSAPSTATVPKSTPGSVVSHIPAATRPSESAESRTLIRESPSGCSACMRVANTISTRPRTATAPNTGSWPSTSVRAPRTGPNSAPATAAASAVPMYWPRCSRGAAPSSQPSAPAHEAAPPMP